MLKMTSQVENIINAYKTLAKIPSITGGKLNTAGNRVTAKWSVRALDKGKSAKYSTNYVLDDSLKVVAQSDFGTDVSSELLSAVSPKETYKAVIREEKNAKDVKKQYLEVWSRNTLAHCIDLTALDLHGDVYADSEFGSLDWNQDETAIVYIAERKPPKTEPYIKRKGDDKPKSNGSGEPAPKKGEEFIYRQDWGEQLVGKYSSCVVVCRLPGESLALLDHLPVGDCPGQVRFSADGSAVVGVAWPTEPRRLGLIFCTNRPSYIFHLTLEGELNKLSESGLAVRSPRLNSDGDVWWLQRKADGPHHACHQLVTRKINSPEPAKIAIDMVQTERQTDSRPFYGVYSQALPSRCFSRDGRVLFSTPQREEVRSYVYDIASGRLSEISTIGSGSTSVLDVSGDIVLASFSNMTTPGQLYVGRLPPRVSEQGIAWVRVSEPISPPLSAASATGPEYLDFVHEGCDDNVKSFNALYFAPKNEDGKKLPLIVWPHGGPHSNFVNAYSLETALFNMLGFASLQINYRGSTGAGEAALRSLPGRCGLVDVADCKLATDGILRRYSESINGHQVVLFGGSHGGFLVTHLSGQHPDTYAAVVSRNPVTDVATMYNYTDINDCVLRINYRGSTGQGDTAVRCLISHVGAYDVADCYLALTTIKQRDRTSDVVLYGGSYGGLIIGHLAAKYDEFEAMVMRNPLIDLATKGHCADNSDGCAVEAGFPYTEAGPMSEDQLVAMRRCSPLAHVHRVRAPTALMLGGGDKRVPCYQGLEYARRLTANGVHTRVYMYEDNHSLSSAAAEMDNLINSAQWFLEHLE